VSHDPRESAGYEGPATGREVPSALAWGLVSKVIVSFLAIGSNVIIVRGLGDENYGIYSIFLNIARFLSLAIGLGQATAILQFLPETRVRADHAGARRLLAHAVLLQLGAWAVVMGAVYLARGWICRVYETDLREILMVGTALIILEVLWTAASNVLMAVRRMLQLTVVSVLQKAALIGLLLLLLRAGLTVNEVIWAGAGSFAIGIVLLGGDIRRSVPPAGARTGATLPSGRGMGFARGVTAGARTHQVLWRSSEVLIVGHYWDAKAAGYVNLSYNLPQLILEFIPLAIWPIILASLAEVHTRRTDDLLRGIRLYFRLIFLLVFPLALTGFVLGGQAYLVLYGQEMAPGAPLCQAYFLVFLLSFLVTPLRMALFVKERVMVNTLVALVGAVINVGFDFVLIPRYGIWGAVPPVTIALLCSNALQYILSRRIIPGLGIPWGYLLRVLAGSAIVAPLWLVRGHLDAPVPLGCALVGGTLAQFLVLRSMRIVGAEERELLLRSHLPFKSLLARLIAPR
jgi:O-antigen/teichoic acid export membrane protein